MTQSVSWMFVVLALTLPAYAADYKGTCRKPVSCNSATVTTERDGHMTVTFSNGLGFTGVRIGGDGPSIFH